MSMRIVRPMTIDDTALVSSNVAENDYAAWNSGTTYAAGNRVISTATHRIYESVQGTNFNHNPTTDTTATWWLDIGPTNRWAMFDNKIGTQTQNAGSIVVDILLNGRQDAVALLDVLADAARIVITDPVDGVVHDETYALRTLVDSSHFSWAFDPIERKSTLVVFDLPKYGGATVTITLTSSSTARCGVCVVGLAKTLGFIQFGARVGIRDFSRKDSDDQGNVIIVARAFHRRASLTVWVAASNVDVVVDLLAGYRATPIVYVGSTIYTSTVVYGFFNDFEVEVAYLDYSICTLQVESLS